MSYRYLVLTAPDLAAAALCLWRDFECIFIRAEMLLARVKDEVCAIVVAAWIMGFLKREEFRVRRKF